MLPVIRKVRKDGAPCERWWDVEGLHILLIELWAGRRLEQFTADRVREELKALWQVPEELLSAFLENSADPFVHIPPNLLMESNTGTAPQFLRGLVGLRKIRLNITEDLIRTRPRLADRPELLEIVLRLQHRLDLEAALRFVRDIPAKDEAALRLDLDTWDERFSRLIHSLTTHETQLLDEQDTDQIYRDRCLQAGRGLYESWLLEDDSLPSEVEAGREAPVPKWIHDEIITGGGRSFRTALGPHAVWLATVETPAHLAAVRALTDTGTEYGIKLDRTDDVVVVHLVLPLGLSDPGPPLEIPYFYPLNAVNPAWQLLHLAAVGRTRLTVVRLTEDGEPRIIGTIIVTIPPDALSLNPPPEFLRSFAG